MKCSRWRSIEFAAAEIAGQNCLTTAMLSVRNMNQESTLTFFAVAYTVAQSSAGQIGFLAFAASSRTSFTTTPNELIAGLLSSCHPHLDGHGIIGCFNRVWPHTKPPWKTALLTCYSSDAWVGGMLSRDLVFLEKSSCLTSLSLLRRLVWSNKSITNLLMTSMDVSSISSGNTSSAFRTGVSCENTFHTSYAGITVSDLYSEMGSFFVITGHKSTHIYPVFRRKHIFAMWCEYCLFYWKL